MSNLGRKVVHGWPKKGEGSIQGSTLFWYENGANMSETKTVKRLNNLQK